MSDVSQADIPIVPTLSALSAYKQDGLFSGFLASVSIPNGPAQLWLYQAAGGGTLNGYSVIAAFASPAQWWLVANSLQQGGAMPAARLVGCRSGLNGWAGGFTSTNWMCSTQSRHVIPNGADAIQLVYSGFQKTSSTAYKEAAVPPSVWALSKGTLVPNAGGSGYAVGDTVTGPTGATTPVPWTARVIGVSGSAITKLQIIKPGIFVGTAPPADGMAQSATSGAGSAATFNTQWDGFAAAYHLSITPAFNTPVLSGNGALELASQGINSDMTEAWDVYIPSGGIAISEPIPVDIAPGTAIGIRGEVFSFNATTGRPTMTVETSAIGNSFFERANQTNVMSPSQVNNIHQPLAIIGIPKIVGPSMLIISDSRTVANGSGTFDGVDSDGNWGWLERAMASTMPFMSFARPSDLLANNINATPPALCRWAIKQALQIGKPTAVYLNLCINDFIAASPVATVQNWEAQMIAFIRSEIPGVIVWTDTCDPNTTSTDGWVTVANQTLSTAGTLAMGRNALLRAGGYPGNGGSVYDFFIDNLGTTEAIVNGAPSGLWVATGTTDGIHQTSAFILRKAAVAGPILQAKLSI